MLEILQHLKVASRKAHLHDLTMAFVVWGIDLIGPLPTVRPAFKYDVGAIDYFTKWAKAKLLATISSKKVQDFVWEAIICRYSIP